MNVGRSRRRQIQIGPVTLRAVMAPLLALWMTAADTPAVADSALHFAISTAMRVRGVDTATGAQFTASLQPGDQVVIDVYVSGKRVHADIDYQKQSYRVLSTGAASGIPLPLSASEIVAFQRLRTGLTKAEQVAGRLWEGLFELIDLIASAPRDTVIDLTRRQGRRSHTYTSICQAIGQSDTAVFREKSYVVTVGPVCYAPPALGRCGQLAGPDPGVGLQQKFTQECLNHDVCCDVTNKNPPVCGKKCGPAFRAAAPGFFFAPDCGTTAGSWTDSFGDSWTLTGGNSKGTPQSFQGMVTTTPTCGTWGVSGTRTGVDISFSATNPGIDPFMCADWVNFDGFYSDCNAANGTWIDSSGNRGSWSWTRSASVQSALPPTRASQN